jgi:chromosome segregation ATPase
VRAARNKIDADLVAVIIRDFGGPRPDSAEVAVKRVDDANRERARLEAQESAVETLLALITYRLERICHESPGAIIAELLRRRAELEQQLASEQADVATIQAQLDLIEKELKKLNAGGAASSPARAARRRAARVEAQAPATAAETAATPAAPADAVVGTAVSTAAAGRRAARNGRRAARSTRSRRR